jgi:transcriptional regulator with XRE-family HTH domain
MRPVLGSPCRQNELEVIPVTPDEIKALRRELGCSAKELAAAIGVDQATVFAWERREKFPTKQYVDQMAALRARGPSSIPRKTKPLAKSSAADSQADGSNAPVLRALADPALWEILRKLLANESLRNEVARLAQRYPDPAGPRPSAVSDSSADGSAGGSSGRSEATAVSGVAGPETKGDG